MKFVITFSAQKMKPTVFGESLTFQLEPSAGQNVNLKYLTYLPMYIYKIKRQEFWLDIHFSGGIV